jgi:hypothetical protein
MSDERKVKRCFLFNPAFVSCVNCELCYGQDNEPTFCQEFSMHIDPSEEEKCIQRATECDYWIPNFRGKAMRIYARTDAPKHERWYEKDSMG